MENRDIDISLSLSLGETTSGSFFTVLHVHVKQSSDVFDSMLQLEQVSERKHDMTNNYGDS